MRAADDQHLPGPSGPAPTPPDPEGAACPPDRRIYVLAASVLGSSMAFIDGTAVTLALPAIQKELGASLGQMLWVSNAYTLFLAALILIGGAFGDIYGRRRIFVTGIAIFAAASLACALSPGPQMLIVARAAQGVGAALLTPLSLALLSAAYPKDKRGGAIGAWAAASAIMTALGPPLGGWLAEYATWRWIFLINLPIGALAIVLALARTPATPPRDPGMPVDWAGAALAVIGLGASAYGLIGWAEAMGVGEAGGRGASSGLWRAGLGLGGLALAGFVIAEMRARAPMAPPQLFVASRCFTVANVETFFLYAALGGVFVFYPFFLIEGHGRGGDEVGLAFLGFAVPMALVSRWSGALIDTMGARIPLTVGPIIAAAGFALMGLTPVSGSIVYGALPAMAVFGLGMAVTVPALSTAVFNSSPEEQAGAASGVNNAIARAAGLFSVAAFGVLAAATFRSAAGPAAAAGFGGWADWPLAETAAPEVFDRYRAAMRAGFEAVAAAAAALGVLSGALAGFLLTNEVEGERGKAMDVRWPQRVAVFARGFGRLWKGPSRGDGG